MNPHAQDMLNDLYQLLLFYDIRQVRLNKGHWYLFDINNRSLMTGRS